VALAAAVGAGALEAAAAPAASASAPGAGASTAEIALARAYAPVIRLKEKPGSCDIGRPYEPTDIDVLMGNDEVALRGPWDRTNIVKVAPTAGDLGRGLFDYHLDFPGDALRPGCTYEQFAARLARLAPPTMYARTVTEPGYPGKLALQYWFFYVYNDWNNKHEGDWEMIQLLFDARGPAEALRGRPTDVGFSQHSSAERARWGDDKLQLEGGTHPVVYPAQGSNANFFRSDLFLMRSGAEGVGCDDTTGPSQTIRPDVAVVPTARARYLRAYPWLGFDGRWGEKQSSFYNGPTGPNDKLQWTRPVTWSRQSWRSESFAVPTATAVGPTTTGFFCGAVAWGSNAVLTVKTHPALSVFGLTVLVAVILWLLTRTSWQGTPALPLSRRRAIGEIIRTSGRMYAGNLRLFLGIGLLFVPLGLLITLVQWLLFRVSFLEPLVDEAGRRNAFVAGLAFVLGLVLTLLGFAVAQAATAHALTDLAAGRRAGARAAYRAVLRRPLPLVRALAIAVVAQVVLDLTLVLIPVAIFLLVRWALLGVIAGVEPEGKGGLLRRSAVLIHGNWWRAATIVIGVTGLALLLGPVLGGLVLVGTSAAFNVVNLISAIVYVAALPFAAIAVTYLYYDLRLRREAALAAPAEADEEALAPA